MPEPIQERQHWHMRKEFSLGTLLVLFVYGLSAIVMMTRMDERLGNLERAAITAERIAIAETNIATNRESIITLEARTLRSLDEIKAALERIETRMHARAGTGE